MSAVAQGIVVALIVLAAVAYAARTVWRTLRPRRDAGCASGCGCGESAADSDRDWSATS